MERSSICSFQVNQHVCLLLSTIHVTYFLTCAYVRFLLLQNPFLVPDVDHGPRGLRRVLCLQAVGSLDHPLPPQSDAGGWGRVTCGRGSHWWRFRITCGWGRVMDEQSVGMSGVTSQRVGGTTRGRDVVPYGTGHK